MASTEDYILYVCEQIHCDWAVRYRKMFGDYMVYVNDKPVLLICNNTVFVKKIDEVRDMMRGAETGVPYKGAREHYILDIDNVELTNQVIEILEGVTLVPVKKTRKGKNRTMQYICQSCGMPMNNKKDFGTSEDGTKNVDYCTYCFKKGKFTNDFNMDEMIEHNLQFVEEFNRSAGTDFNKEQAKAEMNKFFPTLKRWKKNK